MRICIEGIDGAGKTTIVSLLKNDFPNIVFLDRGLLTKLTLLHIDDCPDSLEKDVIIILLDVDPLVAHDRIIKRNLPIDEKYESINALYYYSNVYKSLATKYELSYLDTTHLTIDAVHNILFKYIISNFTDHSWVYKFVNPDNVDVSTLTKIVEGESKIVYKLDDDYTIIQYKPTIYSHTANRAGIIEGSDFERMKMTKDILYILWKEMIPHAYVYIGNKYILCKYIPTSNISRIETVCKTGLTGSDKNRYYDMQTMTNINDEDALIFDGQNWTYDEPYVRLDYRNPNKHPLTGERFGDYPIAENYLRRNKIINVDAHLELALKTFYALQSHFKKFNIMLVDVCFILTKDGQMHLGEISQDCGRYKKIDETKSITIPNNFKFTSEEEKQKFINSSLDKDVWRAGGSSAEVLAKWKLLTILTHDYIIDNIVGK